MRHLVAGGSGGLGAALVAELLGAGEEVRVIVRHPEAARSSLPAGVELVGGDGTDPATLTAAAAPVDAVHLCLNAPYNEWAEWLPRVVTAGLAAARGKILVYPDNTLLYGRLERNPFDEEHPRHPNTTMGRARAEAERRLLEANASGEVRVVIPRFPNLFGPAVGNRFMAGIFRNALVGKRADWLGRLDQPHSVLYTPDAARAMVALTRKEGAHGRSWHVAGSPPVTGRDFIGMVFEGAGKEPRIGTMSSRRARLIGLLVPVVRALAESMYQYDEPFVMDTRRYETEVGALDPTPHRKAIEATLAAYRGRGSAG